MNPLQQWLATKGLTQTALAAVAGADRADVSRVVAGTMRAYGKLRGYLSSKAPDILNAQDSYHEQRKLEIGAMVEATCRH